MAEFAAVLCAGCWTGFSCCCNLAFVIYCCYEQVTSRRFRPIKTEEPLASKSQLESPATPMEDFSGPIDDAQAESFSILQHIN